MDGQDRQDDGRFFTQWRRGRKVQEKSEAGGNCPQITLMDTDGGGRVNYEMRERNEKLTAER